ncbi:glycosyltransferase family 4 protein [Vibrio owensii]|uniref:glycosyltransferase family 4 protein n=1 Tax=Vibrio owensii TaxID=696485 RepID=UPI0033989AA0
MKLLLVHNGELDNDGRVLRSIDAINGAQNLELSIVCRSSKDKKVNSIDCNIFKIPFIGNLLWCIYAYIKYGNKFDIYYCHDYLTLFFALICKISGRKKSLIYDAHELILRDNQGKTRYSSYWLWMEKYLIHYFDLIICANEERAQVMKENYKLHCSPLVIRNVIEKKINNKDVRNEITKKVKILYQGVIEKDRNLDDFILNMSNVNIDFELHFVGGGSNETEVKQLAMDKLGKEKVKWHGYLARDLVHEVIKSVDVGVVYYDSIGLNTQLCAPNKVYEYASFGLPFISSNQVTLKNIIDKNDIGFVLDSDVNNKIRMLIDNYQQYSSNAINFAILNNWSHERILLINKLNRIYNNVY